MILLKKTALGVIGFVFFLIFSPVYFFHQLWHRYILNQPLAASFVFIQQVYAEVLTTTKEALCILMPEADEIKEENKILNDEQRTVIAATTGLELNSVGSNYHFFVGKKKGEVVGYSAEDTVPGKWGPIHYMLLISPQGVIKDVIVLEYQEKRGRPVAKQRFLKQFKGKTKDNKIRLMKDIRGITGASISSNGMTNGIRKMIHVFTELYANH